MNPSYFRIRLDQAEAMKRFASLCERPEIEPPQLVDSLKAVELACDSNGSWRGSALFVYANGEWTIFEDLAGRCSALAAESWLPFAQADDFVFAGYNDAIGYGELIVIEGGKIVREFLFDTGCPEVNVNRGCLSDSSIEPITSWLEIAQYVDEDELAFAERGLLWLHV